LPLNVCDAPKAQAGEVVPLSFELSLREIADTRHQASAPAIDTKLAEQSENVL